MAKKEKRYVFELTACMDGEVDCGVCGTSLVDKPPALVCVSSVMNGEYVTCAAGPGCVSGLGTVRATEAMGKKIVDACCGGGDVVTHPAGHAWPVQTVQGVHH